MRTNEKVYVFQAPSGEVKVGHARRPTARAKQISDDLKIVHVTGNIIEVERVERLAHRILALAGKRIKGEWFSATAEEAVAAIERAIAMAEGLEPVPEPPAHKTTPVTPVRIPADLKEQIEKIAAVETRTLSGAIIALLTEAVAARKRKRT